MVVFPIVSGQKKLKNHWTPLKTGCVEKKKKTLNSLPAGGLWERRNEYQIKVAIHESLVFDPRARTVHRFHDAPSSRKC